MIPASSLRLGASARSLWLLQLLLLSVSFVAAVKLLSLDTGYDGSNGRDSLEQFHVQQSPLYTDSSTQAPVSLKAFEASPNAENEPDVFLKSPSTYVGLLNALRVMESHFFSISHGTWPKAIDWTAAVMGTQVSSSLSVMSEYSSLFMLTAPQVYSHENTINRYFTQVASFYFGENAFSLRTQAYDDMLWVVLGWLESIKFINVHSNLHYARSPSPRQYDSQNSSWYARQFIPQFAHRARLFYDLASKGWDTTLCSGGMVWNPHLAPYKNAVTNQLFIAASVSMYLYFPGDDNASPFSDPASIMTKSQNGMKEGGIPPAKAHDGRYLKNAIEGYRWLKDSGMRNMAGLYVDGFHIRGWRGGRHGSNGTEKCDLRNEKVYTYNQGIILSGLRGLWEAKGDIDYLEDGHELINDVIKATGWDDRGTDQKYRWAGLGRNGILEEQCDWSGTCSQNGQTFKGIFFHHFTVFCSPLSSDEGSNLDRPWLGDEETRTLHQQSCDGYGAWIKKNARAAWVTRDENGEFGEWWGRPSERKEPQDKDDGDEELELEAPPPADEGTDYRNEGVPIDEVWRLTTADHRAYIRNHNVETPMTNLMERTTADLNDRGRGRTVETQSGGLAVLRALWKLVDSRVRREEK